MTGQERLESICRGAISKAPRSGVAWFLMASYLYYCRNVSMFRDEFYDWLATTMGSSWAFFAEHRHAHLVTEADLQAGTLYRMTEDDYPTITKDTAIKLAREHGLI